MKAVEMVLSGRDGRAFLQELMIRRSRIVIQTTLNIPGFPKKMNGDRHLVSIVGLHIEEQVLTLGWKTACSVFIDNGAGPAHLSEIPEGDAAAFKRLVMDIEGRQWGSVLDIDVIGVDGAIHRRALGGAERKCFVCEEAAKLCAREQKHDIAFLRKAAAELIQTGLKEMSC